MADQSTIGDDKMDIQSAAYISFDDVCSSVNVPSFTLYKVEKLCLFFLIDVLLIFSFVLYQFLVPYMVWIGVFWGFRWPSIGNVENTKDYQEKTVSILVTSSFAFTALFVLILCTFLIFDFLYVFSQLRLTFNNQFFLFVSRIYCALVVLCIGVKFVLHLLVLVWVTAFQCPVGVMVFWIVVFSVDAVLVLFPLSLSAIPKFKRSWLFKLGIRDVEPEFLDREGVVTRWQQSLENKIPKMYANIFAFLFLVNILDHMYMLVYSWIKGILKILDSCCTKKFRRGEETDGLLNQYEMD